MSTRAHFRLIQMPCCGQKLLLAGIAALFLATGTAHADSGTRFPLPSVPLPQEMIGTWCMDEEANDQANRETGENVSYYTKREECLELEITLTIRPDGWSEIWDNCPFTKITKEAGGVYLIYSRCEMLAEGDGHGLGKYFITNQEYQIAENGQLIVRQVPEL
jgi:hypothetical protein